MRYADDLCRLALLQRLLPLREREPYSAALDMRFASGTQPDPNPLLPYGRFRAANFDRRPSARGRGCVKTRNAIRVRSILFVFQKKTSQNCTWVHQKRIVEALQTRQRGFLHTLGHFATRRSSKCPPHSGRSRLWNAVEKEVQMSLLAPRSAEGERNTIAAKVI